MKKVSKFFKTIWGLFIAVPVVIFVLTVIVLGFICAIFERLFGCGRVMAVAFLKGLAKGVKKEEKVKTIMQSTMISKSKRTH